VALYGASTTEPGTFMSSSVPDLQDYQRQTTSFDVFGWFQAGGYNLTAPGEPQFVPGAAVTPRSPASSARRCSANGSPTTAAPSSRARCGGASAAARTSSARDHARQPRYTVSGVMPPAFRLPVAGVALTRGETEVWIPLDPSPRDPNPGAASTSPGPAANPASRWNRPRPTPNASRSTLPPGSRAASVLYGGRPRLARAPLNNIRPTLLACSPARAAAADCLRQRGHAAARAIGRPRPRDGDPRRARRPRRQLALRYCRRRRARLSGGAAAGVALSAIFVRQMLDAASDFVRSRGHRHRLDGARLQRRRGARHRRARRPGAAVAGVAHAPNAVLTEGVRASAAAPVRRLSQAFVVAEIALAFTLLTVSAILVVHLQNLGRVSLGFNPMGCSPSTCAAARAAPTCAPRSRAATPASERPRQGGRAAAADRRAAADAGITGAAFANQLPAYPGCLAPPSTSTGGRSTRPDSESVSSSPSPIYLRTMGIPLRRGTICERLRRSCQRRRW
jgi:hypothetical protein